MTGRLLPPGCSVQSARKVIQLIAGLPMTSEIEGVEFDWFAVDSSGCLALFATAGAGFIPSTVSARFHDHAAMSDMLPSPRWGSLMVWDDYSEVGLYVYDWDVCNYSYARTRTPEREMTDELYQRFLAISPLPRFDFEFRSRQTIAGSAVEGIG